MPGLYLENHMHHHLMFKMRTLHGWLVNHKLTVTSMAWKTYYYAKRVVVCGWRCSVMG